MVTIWMMPTSKNVSGGMDSSVTTSRRANPSMSGQYSSSVPGAAALARNLTGLPKADESRLLMLPSAVKTVLPSGKVMRAGGSDAAPFSGSVNAALNANRFGHLDGFLALAILPVAT